MGSATSFETKFRLQNPAFEVQQLFFAEVSLSPIPNRIKPVAESNGLRDNWFSNHISNKISLLSWEIKWPWLQNPIIKLRRLSIYLRSAPHAVQLYSENIQLERKHVWVSDETETVCLPSFYFVVFRVEQPRGTMHRSNSATNDR